MIETGNQKIFISLWGLLDESINQNRIYKAYEYALELVASTQPPLPNALKAVVLEAIKSWEERHPEITRNHFKQALKLAQELGYL
jgi:hypothetical protein